MVMGYLAHKALVVTSWNIEYLEKAHAKAKAICGEYVGPIQGEFTNGQVSFMVAPDGSKEGWQTSTEADDQRELLMDQLDILRTKDVFVDYVEVRFGGNDPQLAEITRHS